MEGWWQNKSLLKFETPTSMFIVCPSNSGNTFFIKTTVGNVVRDVQNATISYLFLLQCVTRVQWKN